LVVVPISLPMLSNGINWFLRSVLLVRFPTRWLTAPAPALPLSPRGSRHTPFSSRLHPLRQPVKPAAHVRRFHRQPDARGLRPIERPQTRQPHCPDPLKLYQVI